MKYKYRVYLIGSPDDDMQITSLLTLKELVDHLNRAASTDYPFVMGRNGTDDKDVAININSISTVFPV
jgi:hypothetical protein